MRDSSVTVNIEVTPKGIQGDNVFCEISPGQGTGPNHVKGGVIKLRDAGTDYVLNFQLMPDDSFPDLAWAADEGGECNAFWSNGNGCPNSKGQDHQVTRPPTVASNGNTVTLQITPRQGASVIHYRMNFDQDGTALQCDPIIINGLGTGHLR